MGRSVAFEHDEYTPPVNGSFSSMLAQAGADEDDSRHMKKYTGQFHYFSILEATILAQQNAAHTCEIAMASACILCRYANSIALYVASLRRNDIMKHGIDSAIEVARVVMAEVPAVVSTTRRVELM